MRNPYQGARRSQKNSVNLEQPIDRYRFFIRQIIEQKQVWGLFKDGWAIGGTSQGGKVLPVWAAKHYALACQNQSWAEHQAIDLSLEKFIFELLPYAEQENVKLSIMMTPDGQSVFLDAQKVLLDLKNFLYEIYSQAPQFFQQNPDVPLPRKIRLN